MWYAVLYVIATVLFTIAGFKGGIHSTNDDLLYFGLAFFSAAHIVEPYFPVNRPR